MSTDIGKVFEKQIEKVFKQLKVSHLLGWHRFSDTGAAGGSIVGEQPSDYLMGFPPGCAPISSRLFFVEAKASEKYQRLQLAMIKPSQRGAINYYGGLLLLPYLVLFWDVQGSRIEVWDGLVALGRDRKKSPRMIWEAVSVGRKLNEGRVATLMAEAFALPPAAATLRQYGDPSA